MSLVDEAGRAILRMPPSAPVQDGASASAPVASGGRTIGDVTVGQANGRLLTAEEVQLGQQLDRMHLVAGLTSAAIAFAIGLYLALTLSRPLRRIRTGAEAMGAGDLDVRVKETGDDEISAVARALNGLAETLQREEELRKESVADLAHELRTPVMGLLARVEAAQDGVFDDEAANLAAMHDEALRLTRLLDDLSALADAQRPGLLLRASPWIWRRSRQGRRRHSRRDSPTKASRSPPISRRRSSPATETAGAGSRQPAHQCPAVHRCRRPREP